MDEPRRTLLLDLLLDLSYDASSYLRRHARPAVRVSAALLVAASLAACSGATPQLPGRAPSAAVQPLQQEVRAGLPSVPGRYPVDAGSVVRDAQGVYHFSWMPAGSLTSGGTASVSRLQLGQASESALDVPAQGDPILYLSPDAKVPLVPAASTSGGPFGGNYGYWYPFYGGHYLGPGYYDPSTRAISAGGAITGSNVSSAPAAPSARTVGLPHTVSGRAGGTGSGQAASNKSGAGTGASSGGGGAPKSGGFSGGRGGAASGASS